MIQLLKNWKIWLIGLLIPSAFAVNFADFGVAVERVTATENNTFKIGIKNYESSEKDGWFEYRLGDKFIAFKPVQLKSKEHSNLRTGQRVWSKIVQIDEVPIVNGEFYEIVFEVRTNFVIDGWNK